MRFVSILAASAATMLFVAPAMAAPSAPLPVPDPITCSLSDVTGAIACAGYYGQNIFSSSSADEGTQTTALNFLGLAGTPNYSVIYNLSNGLKLSSLGGVGTISFPGASTLFGTTYVGVHWGGNQSAIYKLNLTSPVSSLTIKPGNPGGSSNAVLFSTEVFTPPSVPEPASWALMIAGFGIAGIAMRRRAAVSAIQFG